MQTMLLLEQVIWCLHELVKHHTPTPWLFRNPPRVTPFYPCKILGLCVLWVLLDSICKMFFFIIIRNKERFEDIYCTMTHHHLIWKCTEQKKKQIIFNGLTSAWLNNRALENYSQEALFISATLVVYALGHIGTAIHGLRNLCEIDSEWVIIPCAGHCINTSFQQRMTC